MGTARKVTVGVLAFFFFLNQKEQGIHVDKEGDSSISRWISANCSNPDPETLAPDVKNLAVIFLNGSYYYPVFEIK